MAISSLVVDALLLTVGKDFGFHFSPWSTMFRIPLLAAKRLYSLSERRCSGGVVIDGDLPMDYCEPCDSITDL